MREALSAIWSVLCEFFVVAVDALASMAADDTQGAWWTVREGEEE